MSLTVTESFDILGVAPNASKEDIKHAYKQKAFKCHPDRAGEARVFIRLTEARDIILSCIGKVTRRETGRDILIVG